MNFKKSYIVITDQYTQHRYTDKLYCGRSEFCSLHRNCEFLLMIDILLQTIARTLRSVYGGNMKRNTFLYYVFGIILRVREPTSTNLPLL